MTIDLARVDRADEHAIRINPEVIKRGIVCSSLPVAEYRISVDSGAIGEPQT